jgi:class 3 adenylate cyclase
MGRVQKKPLDEPDAIAAFDHGRAELIQLGGWTVGRTVQEPGWRWSTHVRPLVGTEWCMSHHMGLHLTGRLHVLMQDGTELAVEPGDVYDIPPGHDAWTVGDEAAVSFDFSGLRDWVPSRLTIGERVLATIFFTDIVDSTGLAGQLGDRAWRDLLERHDERARAVIGASRGRVIKRTGDGLLAMFDSAARALRCAAAVRERVAELGVAVRIGVHTGEVELAEDDLHGIAVHEAARITGQAGAAEILLSATTRDMIAGAGLDVLERGRFELKGLTGTRTLFLFAGEAAANAERETP